MAGGTATFPSNGYGRSMFLDPSHVGHGLARPLPSGQCAARPAVETLDPERVLPSIDAMQAQRPMTSRVMRGVNAALLLPAASPAAAQQIDVNLARVTDGTSTLVHEISVPASMEAVWKAFDPLCGWRNARKSVL